MENKIIKHLQLQGIKSGYYHLFKLHNPITYDNLILQYKICDKIGLLKFKNIIMKNYDIKNLKIK